MADRIESPFDLVIVASKAYDLPDTMESIAAAVGPQTAILPLLNGLRHLDQLSARFGAGRVLGGLCLISAALDPSGAIVHVNDFHAITFGELDGSKSPREGAIADAFSGANFVSRSSDRILAEMWEKLVFIAAIAGTTCLMRAPIGDVVAAGATGFSHTLLDECAAIAGHNGFPQSAPFLERTRALLALPGSPIAASMLRDIERGSPTEGEHIIGDFLNRGDGQPGSSPLLRLVDAHLKTYEARRKREAEMTKP